MSINNKYRLLVDYKEAVVEGYNALKSYNYFKKTLDVIFPNNDKIKSDLESLFMIYFMNLEYERKVVLFQLINEGKLDYSNCAIAINILRQYSDDNSNWLNDSLVNLKAACGMELDYKFYLSRRRFLSINDETFQWMINLSKGFDIECVKDFLIDNGVYTYNWFNYLMNKGFINIIDINKQFDFIGINNGCVNIPEVNSAATALISISELVKYSLLLHKNVINNDNIVYGNELPIFYEMLYKERNKFINLKISSNSYSKKLIKSFNKEMFKDQIKKLENII